MIKRIILDPSFWLLFAINVYCIYYNSQNTNAFKTIVWLYWCQSVLIGLFNFLFLLTVKNVVPGSFETKNAAGKQIFQSPRQIAFIFLLHYGAFHLGYMIFIFAIIKEGTVDLRFLLLGMVVFSLSLLIDFIRKKNCEHNIAVNINHVFFLPYLRIIPMHFMFLVPAFLGWKASPIFLILKALADLIMYVVTNFMQQRKTSYLS